MLYVFQEVANAQEKWTVDEYDAVDLKHPTAW